MPFTGPKSNRLLQEHGTATGKKVHLQEGDHSTRSRAEDSQAILTQRVPHLAMPWNSVDQPLYFTKVGSRLWGALRNSVKTFAQSSQELLRTGLQESALPHIQSNKFYLKVLLHILSYNACSSKNMYIFIKINFSFIFFQIQVKI